MSERNLYRVGIAFTAGAVALEACSGASQALSTQEAQIETQSQDQTQKEEFIFPATSDAEEIEQQLLSVEFPNSIVSWNVVAKDVATRVASYYEEFKREHKTLDFSRYQLQIIVIATDNATIVYPLLYDGESAVYIPASLTYRNEQEVTLFPPPLPTQTPEFSELFLEDLKDVTTEESSSNTPSTPTTAPTAVPTQTAVVDQIRKTHEGETDIFLFSTEKTVIVSGKEVTKPNTHFAIYITPEKDGYAIVAEFFYYPVDENGVFTGEVESVLFGAPKKVSNQQYTELMAKMTSATGFSLLSLFLPIDAVAGALQPITTPEVTVEALPQPAPTEVPQTFAETAKSLANDLGFSSVAQYVFTENDTEIHFEDSDQDSPLAVLKEMDGINTWVITYYGMETLIGSGIQLTRPQSHIISLSDSQEEKEVYIAKKGSQFLAVTPDGKEQFVGTQNGVFVEWKLLNIGSEWRLQLESLGAVLVENRVEGPAPVGSSGRAYVEYVDPKTGEGWGIQIPLEQAKEMGSKIEYQDIPWLEFVGAGEARFSLNLRASSIENPSWMSDAKGTLSEDGALFSRDVKIKLEDYSPVQTSDGRVALEKKGGEIEYVLMQNGWWTAEAYQFAIEFNLDLTQTYLVHEADVSLNGQLTRATVLTNTMNDMHMAILDPETSEWRKLDWFDKDDIQTMWRHAVPSVEELWKTGWFPGNESTPNKTMLKYHKVRTYGRAPDLFTLTTDEFMGVFTGQWRVVEKTFQNLEDKEQTVRVLERLMVTQYGKQLYAYWIDGLMPDLTMSATGGSMLFLEDIQTETGEYKDHQTTVKVVEEYIRLFKAGDLIGSMLVHFSTVPRDYVTSVYQEVQDTEFHNQFLAFINSGAYPTIQVSKDVALIGSTTLIEPNAP